MKPKKRTILFVVNGMGLGNSTRSLAIVEELVDSGHVIHVATFANGIAVFQNSSLVEKVYPLKSTRYLFSSKKLNTFGILLSAFGFFTSGIFNALTLARLLVSLKPNVVVMDSNYNLVPRIFPFPIVSINNSYLVTRRLMNDGNFHLATSAQAVVEFADRIFQILISNLVLCPWPQAESIGVARIHAIPLIVRKSYLQNASFRPLRKKILVLYSGAGLTEPFHEGLMQSDLDFEVCNPSVDHIRNDIHSKMQGADLVVCQAGFSSISEAIALKKPLLLVPMPGHAEQHANALLIEELGLGKMTTRERLVESAHEIFARYDEFRSRFDALSIPCNGAQIAAQWIESSAYVQS